MARRVTFLEEDLKVIFKEYMGPAGFLQEDQEIVGFEFRTRRVKKGGDYYKDAVPPDQQTAEEEVEEVRKVIVLVR